MCAPVKFPLDYFVLIDENISENDECLREILWKEDLHKEKVQGIETSVYTTMTRPGIVFIKSALNTILRMTPVLNLCNTWNILHV